VSIRILTIAFVALLAGAGCAFRVEDPRGGTWIAGFSRRAIEIQRLDTTNVLVKLASQSAPLELGIVTIGADASLGLKEQTLGYLLPDSATERVLPVSGPTFPLGGSTSIPWRFGFIHYRIPIDGSHVRLLVNTVTGASFRLAPTDPFLRLGYSRTTITTVPADSSISLDVTTDFDSGIPTLNANAPLITE
jgi:hypothetical protein